MKISKVNWNYKNYFLTYAQANGKTKDSLNIFLQGRFSEYGIRRWVISLEKHADGGEHYHAIFCLYTKCHTRRADHFDWESLHPHVKSAGTPDELYHYVVKDGDFIGNWDEIVVPTDYRKRRADLDAYELDKELRLLKSPFPFELPNERLISEPILEKRRHYWFVGPADWGKTTWVNEQFAGKAVFLRPAAKYPYEGYTGEDIIIFDDVSPDGKEELCSITNTWKIRSQVYGDTRYTRKYWKLGHERMVIILSNQEPPFNTEQWFISRFNLIFL